MIDAKRLLTLDEAAQYLRVSKMSLRRWTNDGRLSCHRVGVRGERRFEHGMLDAFLTRGTVTRSAEADTPQAPEADVAKRLDAIANAGGQRHIASFFRNRTEQWEAFRPYFLQHFRAGLPTVYLHELPSSRTVKDHLRAEGIDPQDAIRRGLLVLIPARASYLKTGGFSASRMITRVRRTIAGMRVKGQDRFLFTGEMGWYFTGADGVDEIHDYERRLNALLEGSPNVTIVCQYDVSRFDAVGALKACCSHPLVHMNDRLQHGFYAPLKRGINSAGIGGGDSLKRTLLHGDFPVE
jgi:excisionase family DNA binding protein